MTAVNMKSYFSSRTKTLKRISRIFNIHLTDFDEFAFYIKKCYSLFIFEYLKLHFIIKDKI